MGKRTDNFIVVLVSKESMYLPQQADADDLSLWAEHYRSELSKLWLGKELPAWSQPCEIQVTWSKSNGGGATGFGFSQGGVHSQSSSMDGRPDRVLQDVMPHEITHMIFAHAFGRPVPRWADEGGAVYSESESIDDFQIKCLRDFGERVYPLRSLFGLRDYPAGNEQVKLMYAESYSVAKYLIEAKDRPTFLRFVGNGMQSGWDAALQAHYGIRSVEDLQTDWQSNCFRRRGQNRQQVAQQPQPKRTGLVNVSIGAQQNVTVPKTPLTVAQPEGKSAIATLPTTPDAKLIEPGVTRADLDKFGAALLAKIEAIPAGQKGDKGDRGETGAVGATGQRGQDGKPGERGQDGKSGTNGADGKDASPAMVSVAVQDALAKQPPMTCILKDASGNVINTATFGPNQPLILRLVPVTPPIQSAPSSQSK